jgi:hypothetical protein
LLVELVPQKGYLLAQLLLLVLVLSLEASDKAEQFGLLATAACHSYLGLHCAHRQRPALAGLALLRLAVALPTLFELRVRFGLQLETMASETPL